MPLPQCSGDWCPHATALAQGFTKVYHFDRAADIDTLDLSKLFERQPSPGPSSPTAADQSPETPQEAQASAKHRSAAVALKKPVKDLAVLRGPAVMPRPVKARPVKVRMARVSGSRWLQREVRQAAVPVRSPQKAAPKGQEASSNPKRQWVPRQAPPVEIDAAPADGPCPEGAEAGREGAQSSYETPASAGASVQSAVSTAGAVAVHTASAEPPEKCPVQDLARVLSWSKLNPNAAAWQPATTKH